MIGYKKWYIYIFLNVKYQVNNLHKYKNKEYNKNLQISSNYKIW